MAVEVFIPKMSDHMESGEIVEWLVPEGTVVEKGQPILAITTDKATVELEAPVAGVLKGIREGVAPGAVVPVGDTVAYIAVANENVAALPALAGAGTKAVLAPAAQAVLLPAPLSAPALRTPGEVRATPVVRKLARDMGIDLTLVPGTGTEGRITEHDVRNFADGSKKQAAADAATVLVSPIARRLAEERGIDLAQVKGTGPRGQITKEDVLQFALPAARPKPAAMAADGGSDENWLDLNPIQRLTGERTIESVQTAPQFALATDVDMTNALELRDTWMPVVTQETGERLSITAILVKIAAATLKSFPRANASFQNGRLQLHSEINIGVAMGTEQGLVVPVIRDANHKTLIQITRELKALQDKAGAMRFSPDDLSDGTFTISNLGMYGVDRFNAIINPTQSAILAVGRIIKTPIGMPDDSIALRPMMSCTLSVDHRSMDGVQGANFLALLKERLAHPYLLIE